MLQIQSAEFFVPHGNFTALVRPLIGDNPSPTNIAGRRLVSRVNPDTRSILPSPFIPRPLALRTSSRPEAFRIHLVPYPAFTARNGESIRPRLDLLIFVTPSDFTYRFESNPPAGDCYLPLTLYIFFSTFIVQYCTEHMIRDVIGRLIDLGMPRLVSGFNFHGGHFQ